MKGKAQEKKGIAGVIGVKKNGIGKKVIQEEEEHEERLLQNALEKIATEAKARDKGYVAKKQPPLDDEHHHFAINPATPASAMRNVDEDED